MQVHDTGTAGPSVAWPLAGHYNTWRSLKVPCILYMRTSILPQPGVYLRIIHEILQYKVLIRLMVLKHFTGYIIQYTSETTMTSSLSSDYICT